MTGKLGWLVLGLCCLSSPTTAAPALGAPEPEKQIEKFIRDLGSDDFATREAAHKELEKLGEKAVPALEKAATGSDLEVKRRAQTLLAIVKKRARGKAADALLKLAAKGGVDTLVEYLASRGAEATEDDWELLQKVVAAIEDKAGTKKHTLKTWPVGEAPRLLNARGIAAGEVKDPTVLNGALVAGGSVTGAGGLINAVLFANGDVTLRGGPINTLIVADGDVTMAGGIDCVVVASGSIKCNGGIRCLLVARGAVQTNGGLNITAREKEKVPLDVVKFFDPALLGVETAEVDGRVRVEKVAADSPLGKAGLQKGDVVLKIGSLKVGTEEGLRKALRRQMAEGRATLEVARGGKTVTFGVKLGE